MLKTLEVTYVLADNSEEALENCQKSLSEGKLFDIIFMKLIMPGVNGYDACRQIREMENNFNLKDDERHFICGVSAEVTNCKIYILTNLMQKSSRTARKQP